MHCRTPKKSSIVILILRSKQLSCCYCTDKSPDICTFARFKVNCKVMPLRSFANFNVITSRHRKKLHGAPKLWGPRPWPMRKFVTVRHCQKATVISVHQHLVKHVVTCEFVSGFYFPDQNFGHQVEHNALITSEMDTHHKIK